MAKKERISIFGEAKAKASTTSKSAKDDKEVVYIDGLESKLLELEFLKAQVKDLTAQEKSLNDEIKDISKEKFIELYKANKENPNTFLIKDGKGCVMVIPTDAYKKIDGDRANELMEEYGEDIITVEENYYFNPKVLERNMAAVEKLIMDAKTISDDDKRNLLLPDIKYSITKGSIDKLSKYGSKIQTVIDDIQPTIALKNCGGKMEEGGMMGDDFIGNVYDNEDDGELYYTQDYFEYVDWSGDGNNDGYLYGINLLDNNGDVLDAEWFESDQERRNYVLENNLFEYKFKTGGKVDGRSTRAKDTWNRGGAWTRDRNQFNKSQDWEVPMNKRKYAEGGGIEGNDESGSVDEENFYQLGIDDLPTKYGVNQKWVDSKLNNLGVSISSESRNKLLSELQSRFMDDWENGLLGFSPDKKTIVFLEFDYDNQEGLEEKNSEGDWVAKKDSKYTDFTNQMWEEYYESIADDEDVFKNGGVARNKGRDWIFKSKQKWEQNYDRKREWKEYKKEGWFANWFKDGGEAKEESYFELYNFVDEKMIEGDTVAERMINEKGYSLTFNELLDFVDEKMIEGDEEAERIIKKLGNKYDEQYALGGVAVKVSNNEARGNVNSRTPFRGSNLAGGYIGDVYLVESYGYYPLFVYKDGVWYENMNRYSASTSKQMNQIRPNAETILSSTKELEAMYSKFKDGGVARNKGRDWIFKSKQKWEQNYDRKREWKEYKKEGWFANWFKDGGQAKGAMFKVGDKVRVSSDNDNENYDKFRNKTLIVTDVATSGRGYDSAMKGMALYSFKDIPFSLYEYELEPNYAKGGVARNKGRDWIFKSKQKWEQDYDRKREWKEYKKEGWFANWFKDGGEAFGTVYNEVVNVIMNDQNVSYDEAVNIINTEQMEAWLKDMIEYQGETDANFLAQQILTTDEGKYAQGGVQVEYFAESSESGKISTQTLEEMIGRKLNGWNDNVVVYNGVSYKKCFMQPYYKID